MSSYLFFDTVRLNPDSGGVLNVSEVLLQSMTAASSRENHEVHEVHAVSERYPRLFAIAMRHKVSRFVVDTLLYNWHRLRALWSREQLMFVFPNYFLPLSPLGRQRDCIVIVHDLQYKALPQYFSKNKRRWLDWSLRRLARSAAQVVFISRSSEQDFERHFSACRNASVIFNPVDAAKEPTAAPASAAARTGVRYLIASYHYYPHKNFAGIISLFRQMRQDGLVDALYITGNGAAKVKDMVQSLAPELQPHIVHQGMVSRKALKELYLGAVAFVSLSAFEGFNLSAAEAATLGTPLLLSDIPVHRELFADYAHFIAGDRADSRQIATYLAHHRRASPQWTYTDTCTPQAVAARYLQLGT